MIGFFSILPYFQFHEFSVPQHICSLFKPHLILWRTLFQLHKVVSAADAINETSKGHSIILLDQLFQDERK